jgi:hypothetical protein
MTARTIALWHERTTFPGQCRRLPVSETAGDQGLEVHFPFMATAAADHAQLVR